MPKFAKATTRVAGLVLDLVQAALALLVVVLVSWKMFRVTRTDLVSFKSLPVKVGCLLDGTGKTGMLHGTRFCVYMLAVGLISLIATSVLRCANRCLGCITADACGITNFVSILIDALLLAWWAVAFVLVVSRGQAANKANLSQEPARNGIIAASFGAAFSFFLDILFTTCGIAAS